VVSAPPPALALIPGLRDLSSIGVPRVRQFIHDHGFRPLIPPQRCIPDQQVVGELYSEDAALQRKRYVVERSIGWLKGFCGPRYRVDRTAASFHAAVYVAVLVLCVRRVVSHSLA
jgi:hypothetical protein